VDDVGVRAVCGVAALDRAERLLLVRRADDRTWCLPGGGVRHGETWRQAAERECREETGWQVTVTQLYGVYSDPATQVHRYPDGRAVHFFGAVFLGQVVENVGDHDDEVLEAAFFDRDALPTPLFPPDAPVLRDVVARRPPPVIG
jgi:8-oxo-dGTP diphosphatase